MYVYVIGMERACVCVRECVNVCVCVCVEREICLKQGSLCTSFRKMSETESFCVCE